VSEPTAINYRQSLPAIARPCEKEQQCAWEIHVELRTRITTQRLRYLDGDEAMALDSLVKLFQIVREVCRESSIRKICGVCFGLSWRKPGNSFS